MIVTRMIAGIGCVCILFCTALTFAAAALAPADAPMLAYALEARSAGYMTNTHVLLYDPRVAVQWRLTTHDTNSITPVWSPDGRYLTYWVYSRADINTLILHDLTTGTMTSITASAFFTDKPPGIAWSPDSRYLAYTEFVYGAGPSPTAYITAYDTVTASSTYITDHWPPPTTHLYWDADNTDNVNGHLLYYRAYGTGPELKGILGDVDLATGTVDEFTMNRPCYAESDFVLLPEIAGVICPILPPETGDTPQGDTPPRSLYRVSPGGGYERLTHGPSVYRDVALAPDQTQVAFTVWNGVDSEIGLLDLMTGIERLLTDNDLQDAAPIWAADGRYLAYIQSRGTVPDVMIYDLQSATIRPLTGDPGLDNRPDWSPDGAWLTFAASPTVSDPMALFVGPANIEDGAALQHIATGMDNYSRFQVTWRP